MEDFAEIASAFDHLGRNLIYTFYRHSSLAHRILTTLRTYSHRASALTLALMFGRNTLFSIASFMSSTSISVNTQTGP